MIKFLNFGSTLKIAATALCSMSLTGCFWKNDEPSPSPGWQRPGSGGAQYGGSDSFIAVDWNNGKILAEQNADQRRPVAGIAQIATVLVGLDWLSSRNGDRNAFLIVPQTAPQFGRANPLGLRPGDRMTIRDAMFSAMLADDPVSAEALGEYFGWQMSQQLGNGRAMNVFVDQMNALGKSLGMGKTKFTNSHGLAVSGQPGHSTARDVARLTSYAIKNPQFNFMVAQTTRPVKVVRATGVENQYDIRNENRLLGTMGIDGVKSSFSGDAGQCLVTSARRKDRFIPMSDGRQRRIPYRLVMVTLGSRDSTTQTKQLLRQGWQNYDAWIQSGMLIRDVNRELLNPPR